jgi:predicted AAA+ superfamily ATPase
LSPPFSIPPYIVRETYLNKLKPFIGKPIIKVLTGQRRVGKSYLLFQVMDQLKQLNPAINIIYINKEDLSFASLRNADDLHDYVKTQMLVNKDNALFIDEIQDIEDFHLALRSILRPPDLS